MDCIICCDNKKNFFICKNKECEMKTCCVDCMQKYLINTSSEPHCMSCRHTILTSDFIFTFSKKWRLNIYKEHCKEILYSKEMSKLNKTLDEIDRKNKIIEKKQIIMALNEQIFRHTAELNLLNNSTIKLHNEYKYKCPSENCNGFLNLKYKCQICEKHFCKDCFEEIYQNTNNHQCNEELKATVKEIKRQSKPCPKCGTMISKRSGCNQLFCTNTNCGTAFNWITGIIEKGIIHNPEAYMFYERHPEMRIAYLNRINNQDNNNCLVTQWQITEKFRNIRYLIRHVNNMGILTEIYIILKIIEEFLLKIII